jgi:hypothetical protein
MLKLKQARATPLEASLWERAVETHYKGHSIRVSAVRFPQTGRWTVRSYVSWNYANDSGEETIVRANLQFATVEEAMRQASSLPSSGSK